MCGPVSGEPVGLFGREFGSFKQLGLQDVMRIWLPSARVQDPENLVPFIPVFHMYTHDRALIQQNSLKLISKIRFQISKFLTDPAEQSEAYF